MHTTHFKYKASSTKRIGCYSPPFPDGTTVSPADALDCLCGEIAWVLLNVDTEGVLATRKAVLK
jgi:hypothetical protein